jgi:hypothetical protein
MKKLYIIAALLMASTAAHAGNSVSFEIEGHKIRIEAPKNCDQLSCIKISAPGLSGFDFKGLKSNDDDVADTATPAQDIAAAPAVQATAPQPVAPAVNGAPPLPATTVASTAPAPLANDVAPVSLAPVATVAPAPQPAPVAAAPAPAPAPTTPLGVWAT